MTDLLLNYRAWGAECRDDYLRDLANENGLPLACVRKIAEHLGAREDLRSLFLFARHAVTWCSDATLERQSPGGELVLQDQGHS